MKYSNLIGQQRATLIPVAWSHGSEALSVPVTEFLVRGNFGPADQKWSAQTNFSSKNRSDSEIFGPGADQNYRLKMSAPTSATTAANFG